MICIVDDDPWARSGLESLVLSMGYPVRCFESAEDFLTSDAVDNTDCLISDLNMPGLSGLDLQSQLRSKGYKTPIIFVTAYPIEGHRARALAEGAVGFLGKPFDDDVLVQCLQRAMAA